MNFSRSIAHSLRVTTATFFNPSHHGCFLLILLLLCPIAAAAQGTPPSWVQAFGSSGTGTNIVNAIKVGPDQNLYITGQFTSTANFGGTNISSAGGPDIFVAKYSPSGALQWIAKAGGTQEDIGESLDLDTDGNVYLTGRIQGDATFHSAAPNSKTITVAGGGYGGYAIFLAKYAASGTLQWVQTGTIACVGCYNWGHGIAVNGAAGSVYVAAISQGYTTFSSADGSAHVVSGDGGWHMVLAKYDTNGDFQWGETNYAFPNTVPHAVAVDAADNAYVVGWFEDTAIFSSADGHYLTVDGFSPGQSDSNYPSDTFLAKYDKNGNAKWVNHIGGYIAIPSMVTVGPSGEITLVGYIGNINYGYPQSAMTIATSQPPGTNINLGGGHFTNPYNKDEVIATYSGSGVLTRALRRGGSGFETATGVAYDSRSNLYVTGMTEVNGQPQLFVDEYSGKNLLWEAKATNAGILGGLGQPFTPALSVDAAGSVFVAGGYAGTASFGDIKLSSTGATEVFVAGLNTAFANQSADLFLRINPSTTTVHQGDLLTYAFPVWNLWPDVAYLEVLNTQVPAGTTLDYIRISGTPGLGTCTHPPYEGTGQIVCHENSAMAPNTTWTIRLTVKVTAPAGTVITESAATMSDTPDPKLANNTATVSIKVQ